MASFDLVLRRTQYPTLSPRLSPIVPARPSQLPVLAGTNKIELATNAALNSALRRPVVNRFVSVCPPISGATVTNLNLGNAPASWLEGLGGVAATWGLVSLAGLAVAATGGAAIPAAALLKAGGAIGVGAAASVGASALRQATLESASRRVNLSGGEQVALLPLGDSVCVYTFPLPDPAPTSSGGGASVSLAAAIQEQSSTVRVVALLPDSVEPTTQVKARWDSLTINLSPSDPVAQLGARQWSGIADLPELFDPASQLVDLQIGNSLAGAVPVALVCDPCETGEERPLELIQYRHQLIWQVAGIKGRRKALTLPSQQQLVRPPKPPTLQDGRWRLTSIWRQPGLSFRAELFASETSARSLKSYIEGWPIPPIDIQLTETGRAVNPTNLGRDFEPIRARHWDGIRWRRYYWPD